MAGLLSYVRVFSSGSSEVDRFVDGEKVQQKFFGQMQKLVNKSKTLMNKVKLIQRGPATQMDVTPDSGSLFWCPRFCSIDVVPAFEVDGRIYVAKPKKNELMPSYRWRQSYSVEETRKLMEVGDKDDTCDHQVFRILKVLRNREPGLSLLTSYSGKWMWSYRGNTRIWDSD